jgi:AbrB family looped-hinge helix DNA binding protein
MPRTRISANYQIVLPKEVRERHGLKPGQEIEVISKGNAIVLIPDRPLSAFRGILRGMPTDGYREKKDRR